MKFELEPSDLTAIADMVTRKLIPMFDDLKRTSAQETATRIIQTSTVSDIAKPKSKVVNTSELLRLTGLSRTTIWRLEREGAFPSRRSMSGKRVAWIRIEVEAWIESRSKIA